MRRAWTITAGAMAALVIGAGPALAFEETPAPPPAEAVQVLPEITGPTLDLQTPATGPGAEQGPEQSGGQVFGFSVLPKLDFGLELLYSEQPMALQQGTLPQGSLPHDSDLSVLGKVKRHF